MLCENSEKEANDDLVNNASWKNIKESHLLPEADVCKDGRETKSKTEWQNTV